MRATRLCCVLFCTALVATLDAGAEEPPPDELAGLMGLLGNEAEALEHLREFDRTQQAMADWDLDMAGGLAQDGDKLAAETKQADARRRLDLIRKGYELFLERYSNNARAHTYYGELLYDCYGEQAGALRAWKLAEQLDPKLSLPLNNMAIHYCHGGDYALGLHYLDKTLELEPDNPDFLFNAAQIYLTTTEPVKEHYKWPDAQLYKKAMKVSKRAAELSPADYSLAEDYAVNFFAAERFGVDADWKEAAESWKRARSLTQRPDRIFYTWMNEARACIRGGDKPRAKACLDEALALRPGNGAAINLLESLEKGGAGNE